MAHKLSGLLLELAELPVSPPPIGDSDDSLAAESVPDALSAGDALSPEPLGLLSAAGLSLLSEETDSGVLVLSAGGFAMGQRFTRA